MSAYAQLIVEHVRSLFHKLSSAFQQAEDKFDAVINASKLHRISFNTTSISGGAVVVFDIDATASKPVLVRFDFVVEEVFNAVTTNVVTMGSNTTTSNNVLAAADLDETVLGATFSKVVLIAARTKFYAKYTQTGTAATTGKLMMAATVVSQFNG